MTAAGKLASDIEFAAERLGQWRPVKIARALGRTEKGLRQMLARRHICATRDAGCITARLLALEYLPLSPQRVSALCRNGAIPAVRNPGGRWWLINLDCIPDLQARYGVRGMAANWEPLRAAEIRQRVATRSTPVRSIPLLQVPEQIGPTFGEVVARDQRQRPDALAFAVDADAA